MPSPEERENEEDDDSLDAVEDQLVADVQALQQTERQLFDTLENDDSQLTDEKRTELIDKINHLANMRLNLYATAQGMRVFAHHTKEEAEEAGAQQAFAVQLVEKELNAQKRRLARMRKDRRDQLRLVEIDRYYYDQYAELTTLLQLVAGMLAALIVLATLYHRGWMPASVYYTFCALVGLVGFVRVWAVVANLLMRDNMVYDRFNFAFDVNDQVARATSPEAKATAATAAAAATSWTMPTRGGTCVATQCCAPPLRYDSAKNVCVAAPRTITRTTIDTHAEED